LQLTLEQRLHRFLAREEHDESRNEREMRAQPVDVRVQEGSCIPAATYLGTVSGRYRFRVSENGSKFRAGDAVSISDGRNLDRAAPMSYVHYDVVRAELVLERDAFSRSRGEFTAEDLVIGAEYVLDRRSLGLRGRFSEVVNAAFLNPLIAEVLAGNHVVRSHDSRHQKAIAGLSAAKLNPGQITAGAAAIATESLALVQGPPGTGKTKLLAEVVAFLCRNRCRVAVTAFTNLALANALLAIRSVAPDLPLFKVASSRNDSDAMLRAAGVQFVEPRRMNIPNEDVVVAGTSHQLAKLEHNFHYTVFDEAGQMTIPHALAGMLRSKRWLFFGDHMQLPPVVTAEHRDREACGSIFEYLHHRYGSHLLDTSYRMNDGVCRLVSDTFYGGRLQPSVCAAERRMPFRNGGKLDEVLDPQHPVVWLRIDHMQPSNRSIEEANAVADVVDDLVRHHGVAPTQIAVIAPFRAQGRAVRSALQQKSVPGIEQIAVDTVDRIQGQEREVVVISLATGDPDQARSRNGAFHLSENRLNVAVSRARSKVVLVASRHAFAAMPADPAGLRAASRSRELRDRLVAFDLTAVYRAAPKMA
jgi:DNA replication ATP-dependent helicase Dna2